MDENANPPPPQPGGAVSKQTSSLAVTSLVCALLGWTLLPWIGSLIAVITGHMARAEIRRSPETLDGDGMAVAGLVLGWAMLIFSILCVLMVILFFGSIFALLAALGISGAMH